MAYDTSKAGLAAAGNKQDGIIRDAKAGSPKGVSGAYDDRPNTASPDKGTIAANSINSHTAAQPLAGSTGDTGREKP
jgi:hypothetical protein